MNSDDVSSESHREGATDEQSAGQRSRNQAQRTRPPAIPDRYAALDLAEGELIIYDQGEANAWIQSNVTHSLEHTA